MAQDVNRARIVGLGEASEGAYEEGHKGESTLRIAIHAGGNVDQIAERCREAAVDEIFLGATSVPGFAAQGHLTPEDFQPFREMLAERDVLVSGMIYLNLPEKPCWTRMSRNALISAKPYVPRGNLASILRCSIPSTVSSTFTNTILADR